MLWYHIVFLLLLFFLILLITKETESLHIFVGLFDILFGKMHFQLSCPFFIGLFAILFWFLKIDLFSEFLYHIRALEVLPLTL